MTQTIDLAITSYRRGRYREAVILLTPIAAQGDYLAGVYLSMAREKAGMAPTAKTHQGLRPIENTDSEVRSLARAVVTKQFNRAHAPLMARQLRA